MSAYLQRPHLTPLFVLLHFLLFVDIPVLAGAKSDLIRFSTFNASLYRRESGELIADLRNGNDDQARLVAEIIQRVRPDVLLINEFDYDSKEEAAQLFCTKYLQVGQNGQPPILFPYRYSASVNTGVPSHIDLDGDGLSDQPNDAFGFGRHSGQYGMLLLSRYPIQSEYVRTFRTFLWKDMPQNLMPKTPEGQSFYSTEATAVFRLSSKSHWDVPIKIGNRVINVLAAHPTPPIFDGNEKRNARRNHDEIRLWADYIDPNRSGYLYDDMGRHGGLPDKAQFVILGDYNGDPFDGNSHEHAIRQLTEHPLVHSLIVPQSDGAVEDSEKHPNQNRDHRGRPEFDTADFSEVDGPGNLRVDYVLPSQSLKASNAGVFWPKLFGDGANLIDVSDHRLVWVDVKIMP